MRNLLIILFLLIHGVYINAQTVTGELKKWHKITIEFTDNETYTETGTPNPFLDRRLNVTFTGPSSQTYKVPGYFAADGNAAETSATSGNKFHVHFSPDEVGVWNWSAVFRGGTDVAVTYPSAPTNGSANVMTSALSGSFTIGANDKTGRDFRAHGRLEYDGTRYPKFAETGLPFIKAGPDSPENFLAYDEFNDVGYYAAPNRIKDWTAHTAEWVSGDPQWQTDQGRDIIGAINYIADTKGLNSISFLTMNKVRGDTKDVTMNVDAGYSGSPPQNAGPIPSYLNYDVSRTAQWEIVFSHAQSKGVFLHFKTQEQENASQLDEALDGINPWHGGALGPERKLYFRELIARFGHHLALNWNMGEENEGNIAQGDLVYAAERRAQLAYVKDIDPYDHLRVVHSSGAQASQDAMYDSLIGPSHDLTGVSLQNARNTLNTRVKHWVDESTTASKPWPISSDETAAGATDTQEFREEKIYGVYFAGGWGIEVYVAGQDLTLDDWNSGVLPNVWDYMKHGIDFMDLIPFTQMDGDNSKISGTGNIAFVDENNTYAAYLPSANGNPTLDIGNTSDTYTVKWYDPRNGGSLVDGTVTSITSNGSLQNVGAPPNSTTSDWVVLATNDNTGGTINVTGVSISPLTPTNFVGETQQFTETVLPANADDKTGLWTSTDNTRITIDTNTGLATMVAVGSATIRFTSTDGGIIGQTLATVSALPTQLIAKPNRITLNGSAVGGLYLGATKVY